MRRSARGYDAVERLSMFFSQKKVAFWLMHDRGKVEANGELGENYLNVVPRNIYLSLCCEFEEV